MAAICLTSIITMAFIFIGQVNVLAPIVTINFMLTYIMVDYSYFSVSMSYSLQQNSKRTLREDSKVVLACSWPLIFDKPSCYGTDGMIQSRSDGTLLEFTKDMDHLFRPPSKDHEASNEPKENHQDISQMVVWKKQKKAAKQTLQDSFLLDPDPTIAPSQDLCRDVLESNEQCIESFSESTHPDGELASPYANTKQKRDPGGTQYLHETLNTPIQKTEGKKI